MKTYDQAQAELRRRAERDGVDIQTCAIASDGRNLWPLVGHGDVAQFLTTEEPDDATAAFLSDVRRWLSLPGHSQNRLARLSGVAQGYISKILAGKSQASDDARGRIRTVMVATAVRDDDDLARMGVVL